MTTSANIADKSWQIQATSEDTKEQAKPARRPGTLTMHLNWLTVSETTNYNNEVYLVVIIVFSMNPMISCFSSEIVRIPSDVPCSAHTIGETYPARFV